MGSSGNEVVNEDVIHTFVDTLEMSSRSADPNIQPYSAEINDHRYLDNTGGLNEFVKNEDKKNTKYSNQYSFYSEENENVFYDFLDEDDALRLVDENRDFNEADLNPKSKKQQQKHIPEYHHKCCGDYPVRYPYFVGDHDSRK